MSKYSDTLASLSSKPAQQMLYRHWLIEAVRLREEETGALEDAQAVRHALQQPALIETRLQARALFLAKRDGLIDALEQWLHGVRIAYFLLMLLAVVLGLSLSKAALMTQDGTVNVFVAVLALLGANSIGLFLWLAGFALNKHQTSNWITHLSLWLSERLARRAKKAHLIPALLLLLQRQNALFWASAKYLHLWWLLLLISSLVSFLLMLSLRRYGFAWESTIVNSNAFSSIIYAIGWLPHWLGFPQPDATLIQRSGELASFVESDRHVWAYWLIGLVVVYGVIPRLLLGVISSLIFNARLKNLYIDPNLPIWLELHDRLLPPTTQIIDPAPQHIEIKAAQPRIAQGLTENNAALVALEINPLRQWQPDTEHYLGALDSRSMRNQILDQLSAKPIKRLLIACDPSSSIDRGTLNLLADLAQFCEQLRVWLLPETEQIQYEDHRLADWKNRLIQQQIAFTSEPNAQQWLENTHD